MYCFQFIDHVKNCLAIWKLAKEGQVKLTVRTLETASYGRKVITNNKAVKYCNIYICLVIYIFWKMTIIIS